METHDRLVQAYLDYFKANESFNKKTTVRKYYKVQQTVRLIKELTDIRKKEIREHYLATKKTRK